MNPAKCPRCGGETASGELKQRRQTTGSVEFRPRNAPFWSFLSSAIRVSASMCLDCSFLESWGDTQRAREVLRRDK